jgi:hypothetical protein
MSNFQKQFQIKMTQNTDIELEEWLLATTNQETLDRYRKIKDLHNNSVQQAIACGDCFIDNQDSVANIHWRSDEVHQSYINQWPVKEHEFYMKVWNSFLSRQ